MNFTLIKRLMFKDWYLQRWPVVASLGGGAVALFLIGNGGTGAFYTGSLLLLTVLVSIGGQLVMANVVNERKEQTLPFVLSLPISHLEYTISKILGVGLLFLVPFLACLLGTVLVILGREAIPDGLVPFSVIVLTEIAVSTAFILAVALVTESQGWTIAAIVVGNLCLNGILYITAHIPEIGNSMSGTAVAWSPAAVGMILLEVLAIGMIFVVTLALESRKKEFI